MSNPFTAVALLIVVAVALMTSGCASYQMDRQDRCMMQHTWDTTIISGYGIAGCASTPWYNERRTLDQ